jgi:hypothetical protein
MNVNATSLEQLQIDCGLPRDWPGDLPVIRNSGTRCRVGGPKCVGRLQDSSEYLYEDGSSDTGEKIVNCQVDYLGNTFRWIEPAV